VDDALVAASRPGLELTAAAIGPLLLAAGGLVWAVGMSALAAVRPALDSNLFFAPFIGGALIGVGAGIVAGSPAGARLSRAARVGAIVAGVGGAALIVGLAANFANRYELGLLSILGLLAVLIGSVILGIALVMRGAARRIPGLAITVGVVASVVLFPGVDPTGTALTAKIAAQIAAAVVYGLGWVALAWITSFSAGAESSAQEIASR
jgi:hypothetical protein